MPTVCIGDEFETDLDGRLKINIQGDPVDLAWPYPCPVGANNGLHRTPGGGLWVPPSPVIGTAAVQGTLVHASSAVPSAMTTVESADIVINNPSACHTAQVMLWVMVDIDFSIPVSDARAGARVAADEFFRFENPAPAGGSTWDGHIQYTHPIIGAPDIAPGGVQLYSTPIDVGLGQGGSTYGDIRWGVRALIMAMP